MRSYFAFQRGGVLGVSVAGVLREYDNGGEVKLWPCDIYHTVIVCFMVCFLI